MEMYTLTLRDGRTIDACKDHTWKVYNKNKGKYEEKQTEYLFNNYSNKRIDSKYKTKHNKIKYVNEYKFALPNNKCIEQATKDYYVHPYVLGCLLGDGCINDNAVTLTSGDKELVNRFISLLPEEYYGQVYNKKN